MSHDDDDVLGKAYDARLMQRLGRYARPFIRWHVLILLITLGLMATELAGPWIIKSALDGPLSPEAASGAGAGRRRALYHFALIFLGFVAARYVVRWGHTILMNWVGQQMMLRLRMDLFRRIQGLSLRFHDRNPVGRLVTRLTNDVEALNELFTSGIVTLIADVLVLFGIMGLLIWRNFLLALIALATFPFVVAATFAFRYYGRKGYRAVRRQLTRMNAYTQESIQGISVTQAFRQEEANYKRFEKIHDDYLGAHISTNLAYAVYFPVIELLMAISTALIVWRGGHDILAGELAYGDFYLFWTLLGRFFWPIRDLGEKYNVLQSAMASAERIFLIIDTEPEITDGPGARPVERLAGDIEFEEVWFAYDADISESPTYVLRDVSFRVAPGEVVAIVGATGAGKSTVVNLLSRFYDVQRGRVLIDGVPITEYRVQDLRRRIGVVLQDPFIFSASIRENIDLGDELIAEERVLEAAEQVGALRFIERLPSGFEEVMKERGGTVSTGQKQLLAFARVLASDPDILILDEATANIDTETEQRIQAATTKLFEGRTAIVVAHRLSTVRRADRILVFHKGRLREEGNHETLLAQQGIYYRLCELQFGGADESA